MHGGGRDRRRTHGGRASQLLRAPCYDHSFRTKCSFCFAITLQDGGRKQLCAHEKRAIVVKHFPSAKRSHSYKRASTGVAQSFGKPCPTFSVQSVRRQSSVTGCGVAGAEWSAYGSCVFVMQVGAPEAQAESDSIAAVTVTSPRRAGPAEAPSPRLSEMKKRHSES